MAHTFEVGIKGVIVNKLRKKVLFLTSIDDKGTTILEFPGGRMEEGETIKQTVSREIGEEIKNLGSFEIKDILTANPRSFNLQNGNGLMLISVLVETEIDTPILSHEHTGFKWLSREDIEKEVPLNIDEAVLDNEAYKQAALIALSNL